MAQPAWITYPQIEDLNSGRTTRDANTRLINNLTAMFGTTPNEFLTTSNVEFDNVTAVTFVGDGSALTNLVSPGPGGSTSTGTLSMVANSAGGSPVAIHAFINNGVEFGRFDKDGNFGFGTNAPSEALEIFTASGSKTLLIDSDSFTTTQSVRIRAQGKKAGGSDRAATIMSFYNNVSTSDQTCGVLILAASDGSSSNLWIDDADQLRTSTNAANIGTTLGTVVGTQTSDERLKTISKDAFKYGLSDVLKLIPIEYTDASNISKLGFGAQTTRPLIPEVVFDTGDKLTEDSPDSEPTKLGMEYVQIIPILTAGIQELNTKIISEIDQLKERVAELENQLAEFIANNN